MAPDRSPVAAEIVLLPVLGFMAALAHFAQQPVERRDLSCDLLVGIPLELD